MGQQSLHELSDKDNLLILVEQFKMGLISRATGKGYEDEEYRKNRKLILQVTALNNLVPHFLRLCRTVEDFWQWIKNYASTYDERRKFLSSQFNPIIDALEYEAGPAALEFSQNYEEKEILGNGGFGTVFKYEHRLLKLPFAVKIFSPAFYHEGSQEKEMERFFQEARMLFALDHPNISKIYDVGLLGTRPFIRMEYIQGKNLNRVLQDSGIYDVASSISVMKQIVSAVAHAHEIGIIHRDLKPSNLMISETGKSKVIDFGMGVFVENELHSRLTETGMHTTSGLYAAPEFVADPKLVDKRSDIYSLGSIWYTLLTGQPPAGSDIMSILDSSGVNKDVVDILRTCLNPISERYPNCDVLLTTIDAVI